MPSALIRFRAGLSRWHSAGARAISRNQTKGREIRAMQDILQRLEEMRDQAALVREACKWDYELRFPEQVIELVDRAHAIANSTPRGPVSSLRALPRTSLRSG